MLMKRAETKRRAEGSSCWSRPGLPISFTSATRRFAISSIVCEQGAAWTRHGGTRRGMQQSACPHRSTRTPVILFAICQTPKVNDLESVKRLGAVILCAFLLGCAPAIRFEPLVGFSPVLERERGCSLEWIDRAVKIARPHVRLGEMLVDERDMPLGCDEETVRRLIEEDSCVLGADAIVILSIRRPKMGSSCRGIRVGLIRYSDG